jgi:hypothetical protein
MTEVLDPSHGGVDGSVADDEPRPGPSPGVEESPDDSETGASARRPWSVDRLPGNALASVVSLAVALVACAYVFAQLHPRLLLSDTTPAGGDMGAHVWGPAYLRDHLLPQFRVTGWTPDWYAGFPAYHFYMVVPALAIVALNAGLTPLLGVPLAAAVLIGAWWATSRRPAWRIAAMVAAVVVAVLVVSVPYGVAFKLISVSGVVLMPLAGWTMARFFGAPQPVPGLVPLAVLVFLFDTNFTIYGGNIASTLAGEFSFSMALALALLALGLVARGLDTGRGRAGAAVALALVGLNHLIPVFFTVVASLLLVALAPRIQRSWWLAVGASAALLPVGMAPGAGPGLRFLTAAPLIVTVVLLLVSSGEVRDRVRWLVPTGVVAVLLAAFWMLPFVAREPFMNDMGWERLQAVGEALLTTPMLIALPVAVVGFGLAVAYRERLGVLFGLLALVSASATANIPDTRLWNARLLPFFYLSVYVLAAVAIGLVLRSAAVALSERYERPEPTVLWLSPLVALVVALVAIGMPLRNLPGGERQVDGTYRWLVFENRAASFIPGWASWNYSGYEAKPAYREYHAVVSTMDELGRDRGCGRSMWEYSKELDRYGTPMALMLLPHWTDGCIGSMEGLYFESSMTTPFHFLNQSVLSENPSRAQRDLPYRSLGEPSGFDVGIRQLQLFGVRYYLASSEAAIGAARGHPDLAEVAASPPWVVFEVADSSVVAPLAQLPVVVEGATVANAVHADRFRSGWLGEAVTSFNTLGASPGPLPAESGPDSWPRAATLATAPEVAAGEVRVSEVSLGRHGLSFRVDRTGEPVLVKVSHFPNWTASGADGPWRVGPNLMAVVPTATEVRLHYGRTAVDWMAWLLSAAGIAGLVLLVRADRRPEPAG